MNMKRTRTTLGFLALLAGTASADHAVYQRRLYAQPSAPQQYSSQHWSPQYSQPQYSSQSSLRDAPQNQQPQTEARYQERNKLADVGLAGFNNRAFIQLPQTARALDYLELRAGRTPVALRDVVVQFADGSSIRTGSRGVVEPFEGRVINLPAGCSPVVAIVPEYDTPRDRNARLEVFGVPEHRNDWRYSSNW
jgi:hypothetical protein